MSKQYPVLPLRDLVVYPKNVTPLFVGRKKSIHALQRAKNEVGNSIVLVAQKDASEEDPSPKRIYKVGTMATILQMVSLPDDTYKILAEGKKRVAIEQISDEDGCLMAKTTDIDDDDSKVPQTEIKALMRSMSDMLGHYARLNKKVPHELLVSVSSFDDPRRFADMLSAYMPVKLEQKQKLLETGSVCEQFELLMKMLEVEMDILDAEKNIRDRVKQQMEKNQREYYMNEQIKAIRKELGQADAPQEEEDFKKKIADAKMPKETKKRAETELNRLSMMSATSAEATVVRNYLEWLVSMPWSKKTRLKKVDLTFAQKVLDEDHFGLEKVKERILEYLAVQERVKKIKGPILCLVGSPGVGKTSLGRSIARATGRKLARMSLGGVRDEAEIRGHRRTYIGSMPGKFVQNLAKVGVKNPLFLLDEIDKLSSDIRGDPASALLEVLDPEQNALFQDHYLEVEFDLSDVMFVCTANTTNMIPPALLDRMEVIRLSGYTEEEKRRIAQGYLIPRQIKENGLRDSEIEIPDATVKDIIRHYTREAGVRNLEREISKICRKVVKEILTSKARGKKKRVNRVTIKSLEKHLGVQKFRYGRMSEQDRIGQVTGLAWTDSGGDLLTVESASVPGTGKLSRTGKLGDVMQESVNAAMTVVRSCAQSIGLAKEFYQEIDMHVHVPEGATPKDGPSAGIAIAVAMVSALTRIPVKSEIAMTGEITLRGEVLPIGGLKEKLLAAMRGGIKTVLIPYDNEKDLAEIPANIKNRLDIKCVRWIDEVLQLSLTKAPYVNNPIADKSRELNEARERSGRNAH